MSKYGLHNVMFGEIGLPTVYDSVQRDLKMAVDRLPEK